MSVNIGAASSANFRRRQSSKSQALYSQIQDLCRHDLPRAREITNTTGLDREFGLTVAGIVFSLVAGGFVAFELLDILVTQFREARWGAAVGHLLFMLIVTFLFYGALIYQFTRGIYLRRRRQYRPVKQADLELPIGKRWPSLTILVPAYMEEPDVVRKTLLSAALQDYPNKRVVLLIDDPPENDSENPSDRLRQMRLLASEVQALIAARWRRAKAIRAENTARSISVGHDLRSDMNGVIDLYRESAEWLIDLTGNNDQADPMTQALNEGVLATNAKMFLARADELDELFASGVAFHRRQVDSEYQRLAGLFNARVSCFERKKYENLSHRPNKAMNLNAYLGLMGGSYREVHADSALRLQETAKSEADLNIPDSDYIVMLDADSIVVADYARRLIWQAEQPGNEQLAVIQTPYSAFPGAESDVERIAGATTDIQYIIHQGFVGANAAYWVGANAVLRKSALDDIATIGQERNFPVKIFIQDRTVIEDTESTVDLIDRGWQLFNYPCRMAYSATPPDFGSLLIQRRRWANGGLLILPKLLNYLVRSGSVHASKVTVRLAEGLMRIHYLVSIAAVNFGLVIILGIPFSESMRSAWLPLSVLPYFILYARDLLLCGYRISDLFRVYALNLILIPVNIGGVLKSIHQAFTKKKIAFARTPKVKDRTAVAAIYLFAEYALLVNWVGQTVVDVQAGFWLHAAFVAGSAILLLYGLIRFIGLRASVEDIRAIIDQRSRLLPESIQVVAGQTASN